jgi:hypothetical protein
MYTTLSKGLGMTQVEEIQIGDIVRVREPLALMPIYKNVPDEIPAGIFGEVIDYYEDAGGTYYRVEFHEPYEYANEIPLPPGSLEIMFRFSAN